MGKWDLQEKKQKRESWLGEQIWKQWLNKHSLMHHKCHWMCLFNFIIIFHVATYVVVSLTGTRPVLHWEISFKGWLLVNAGISLLPKRHKVMWLLKGALQSLLERAALGWVDGSPCEQHPCTLPVARVDNVFCPPRFLGRPKMLLF